MLDPLLYLLIGTCTALWRLCWLGFILPVWRIAKWIAAALAAGWVVNRLEREYETGAYHQ